jgi:hypothetical protein
MKDLFLTPSELVQLTGFKAAHCQVRWLQRNRWRFALTRRKEPRVARDHFNGRMGCAEASESDQSEAINDAARLEQPDFGALDRR